MPIVLLMLALFCVSTNRLAAEICGKVDLGAAYVHLDILESGRTIDTKNMAAFKGDATILFYQGWCLKPTLLISCNPTDLVSGGCGIGHYTPLTDTISVTPSIGCNFTYLRTTIDVMIPVIEQEMRFKERFQSASPYVGLDVSWCFTPQWRVCATVQYAWSKTRTTIKHLLTDKSHTQGPSYAILLERDICSWLSVNVGAAYNISLSKERHGLRASGAKVGLAVWF